MNRKKNPFTIASTTKPKQLIARNQQIDEIIDSFSADTPCTPLYILTGIAGSGKTTLMTSVCDEFRKNKDWVVMSFFIICRRSI